MRTLTTALILTASMYLCTGVFVSTLYGQGSPARQTVLQMLTGYEYMPSKADLEALGPGVPATLIDIARDPHTLKRQRIRALELLRHYPDRSEVQTFLAGLLLQKGLPAGVLRSTIKTLGRTGKGKSIDTIKPYLSSEDVHIREAAAQALLDAHDPSAKRLLDAAAAKESRPYLKKRLMEMSRKLENDSPKEDRFR